MSTVPSAESPAKSSSPLDSCKPTFVPYAEELFYDRPSFQAYLQSLALAPRQDDAMKVDPPSTASSSQFMDALRSEEPTLPENRVFTEKGAIAHASTESPRLDLFTELEKLVTSKRLVELLDASWAEDPLDTLKIIWNARSIHIGKGEKETWYKCLGWLKEKHPLTLIANFEWVVRPVVEKTVNKDEKEGSMDVEFEKLDLEDGDDQTRFDVKDGGSHGYYKDLINLLKLAVHDSLDALKEPDDTLKIELQTKADGFVNFPGFRGRGGRGRARERGRGRGGLCVHIASVEKPTKRAKQSDEEKAQKKKANIVLHEAQMKQFALETQERRRAKERETHERFVTKFTEDPFYRALHLHVSRIFADALTNDLKHLNSSTKADINAISIAAKWAPSSHGSHDRDTFVASTIAELMFPPMDINKAHCSREEYLKYAREHYRRAVSSLRKALDVVERKIVAQMWADIKYNRVPSIAMDRYKTLFATKDLERFEKYLTDVASGKAKISGAVMTPSALIAQARAFAHIPPILDAKNTDAFIKAKIIELESQVVDAQWNALLQRMRDSGTLENAIAVVDVSGSMGGPCFSDGTCPMDSSVGLGLLLARLAKHPFQNTFIAFSENPQVITVDPNKSLREQIYSMQNAEWDMTTDFNAVFEKLLLPMAVANKIPQEQMIKRVFVFSDMQMDSAEATPRWYSGPQNDTKWETNHERIKRKYEEAGYECPELVYWNLAGRTSKPVTSETEGTALVSGYSQAMLKVFLDNGGFEDVDEEDEEVVVDVDEEGEVVQRVQKMMDPLRTVKKAIGHKSFAMLKVVD